MKIITDLRNPTQSRTSVLLVVLLLITGTLIIGTDFFSAPLGAARAFQSDSEHLVIDKVTAANSFSVEWQRFGGFLHRPNGEPYFSQSGLQGNVLYLLARLIPADFLLSAARIVYVFVFMAVLLVPGLTLRRELGLIGLTIASLLMMSFARFADYAPNLYWVLFLQFAPFAAAWIFYPRRRGVFWGVIALLVMLKSLSGYEFVTNVITAASVPAVYFGVLERQPFRRIAREVVLVCAAGAAGFFAALVIHIVQWVLFYGEWQTPLRILGARIMERTIGQQLEQCSAVTLPNIAFAATRYMMQPLTFWQRGQDVALINTAALHAVYLAALPFVILPHRRQILRRVVMIAAGVLIAAVLLDILFFESALNLTMTSASRVITVHVPTVILSVAFVLFGIGMAIYALRSRRPIPPDRPLMALYAAAGWGMVCAWTWFAFGINHMMCHFHIASVVYMLPFGVMIALLVAAIVTRCGYPVVSGSSTPPLTTT